MKELSIVIPVYNEEGNIITLHQELKNELSSLVSSYEIIFVDDGSSDGTPNILDELTQSEDHVLGISLSRNFGHQVAIVAGLEHAKGDYVIMMDGDLQHPPSMIPVLFNKAKEGFDVVNTIREDADQTGTVKRSTSKGYYRVMSVFSEVKIHKASADFRLMNRKTVDAFLKLKEKDRFTRGLISWMGFSQTFVPFKATDRHSGKTKYGYRQMIRFAGDGLFSFSSKPLRFSFYTGLIICFLGLIYAGFVITAYFRGNTIPGWASLMITVLFLGGIQLLSIGIIGEYLRRVFNEVKDRPMYFVKDYFAKAKSPENEPSGHSS